MKRKLFFSSSLLGMDIQQEGCWLVQLKKQQQCFQVEYAAKEKLPGSIFVEGKIRHWDKLTAVLSQYIDQHGLAGLPAAISLPANLVRTQRISLPLGLADADIEAEILARVKRDLPGMTEALCLDFTQMTQANAGYGDVLFTVARQEYVSQYADCVKAAGLNVKIVDIDIYAIHRVATYVLAMSGHQNEISALIYVSNSIISFMMFDAHEMLIHQQWEMMKSSTQIHHKIQLCLAAFPKAEIKRLILCDENELLNIHELKSWREWKVETPDLSGRLKWSAQMNSTVLPLHQSEWWVAMGLAMRDVPAW